MSVENVVNRIDHNPDGIEDTFIYDFRVAKAPDMTVYADGIVYGGSFVVTGLDSPTGGTVIFDEIPSASIGNLTLYRLVPATQMIIYPRLTPFPSASHEAALDKLTWLVQQVQETLSRSLVSPVDVGTVDYTAPAYVAGEFWRWDPLEEKMITSTVNDLGVLSEGVSVGDVVRLVDVGGAPGWPSLAGDGLTVGGAVVQEAATKTVAEIGATFAANSTCIPVGFESYCSASSPFLGWFHKDGSARSMTVYLALHQYLGGMYGLNAGTVYTAVFATDTFSAVSHGLVDGEVLRHTTSGADLPSPLVIDTDYYVRDSTVNTFKLSTTLGGGVIDLIDDGTGTHKFHEEFILPDDRGQFIRLTDGGAGVDMDAAIRTDRGDGIGGDVEGSNQDSQNLAHTHPTVTGSSTGIVVGGGTQFFLLAGTNPTGSSGGNQSNPINTDRLGIIKY